MNTTESIQDRCAESYGRLRHLRMVGDELGIPWQSVYVNLRKAGVAVVGDKSRYGSDKDRLAARGEREFQSLVPFAKNQNEVKFQSKVDFIVEGYGVDVKSSLLRKGHSATKTYRWAFSMKKQEMLADFIVCFGFYNDKNDYVTFLIPGELIRKYQTISIGSQGKSKWKDYEINPECIKGFFSDLPPNFLKERG